MVRLPAMSVMALDPSSKAIGWAVADAAGSRCGAFHPLDWRSKAKTEFNRHQHMCGRAGEWLADMLTDHAPEVVVLETAVPIRGSRCLERLAGALLLVLYTREILTAPAQPTVWQRWAKLNLPMMFERWLADGKPDDRAAAMILEWWLTTQAHRVEAA